MTPASKKTAAIALCAVAILVCLVQWLRHRPQITRQMGHRPRVCDACGHRFDGAALPVMVPCPACGKKAGVRAYFYACRSCGERFEAYRERPAEPAKVTDPGRPHELLVKRPGGPWVKTIKELGPIRCPECKSADVHVPLPR